MGTGQLDAAVRAQGRVTRTVVVASILVFLPALNRAFTLPKAATLLLGAVAVALLAVGRVGIAGRLQIPWSPIAAFAAAFAAAALVTAMASDAPLLATIGSGGRYVGALSQFAGVVILLSTLRTDGPTQVRRMLVVLGVTCTVVSAIAAAQMAGFDITGVAGRATLTLVDAGIVLRSATSTMGNPNFTAVVAALGVVLAATGVAAPRGPSWPAEARYWSLGALVVCGLGVVASLSTQGLFASVAGLGIVGIVHARKRTGAVRWALPAAIVAAGILGGAVVVAGLFEVGPLQALGREYSFQLRKFYWGAAVDMWRDHTVLGVGPDRYEAFFRAYRSPAAAAYVPFAKQADAAHNIVLHHLATGGLLTTIPYVAVITLAGARIVAALRHPGDTDPTLLAAAAGGWVVLQVQGLVSLEMSALQALHWYLTAAAVIVTGPVAVRSFALPWALPPGGGRAAGARRLRTRIVSVVAVLVALPLVVLVGRTVAADARDRQSTLVANRGDTNGALAAATTAYDLAPWYPEYGLLLAARQVGTGNVEEALLTYEEVLERDPRRIEAFVTTARLYADTDRLDLARDWYERARTLEPHAAQLTAEFAGVLLRLGDGDRAIELLNEALTADPDLEFARQLLAEAGES